MSHFLAFGDSTTAGENGIDTDTDPFPDQYVTPACGTSTLQSAASTLSTGAAAPLPQYFDPSASYPQQLLNLLKARFVGESFVMENEGRPGELSSEGEKRLAQTCLPADHPDVVLLLEGINDIASSTTAWAPTPAEELAIVSHLQNDVIAAKRNGARYVFVSTILPVDYCTTDPCRGAHPNLQDDRALKNAVIDRVNALVRLCLHGATLVEANAAFMSADPTLVSLIDQDGLHPTKAGYGVQARAWMAAIVSRIPTA